VCELCVSEQLAAAEQKGKAEAALQAELIQQQEFVSLLTTDPGLWTLKYNVQDTLHIVLCYIITD
jgi:hypothetical protein